MKQDNIRLVTDLISKLPNSLANSLINFFTTNVSIDIWDDKLLGLKEKPIKTIIDVGANIGQSTKKFAKIFPKATIHAFEPLQEPFLKLEQLSKQNFHIISYNFALGDEEKKLTFFDHEKCTVSSSFLKTTQETKEDFPILKHQKEIIVEQLTLDGCFEKKLNSLESEILIKLDVQGYEKNVIKGGLKTFKRANACIIEISVDNVYEGQSTFKDIFVLLDSLGYKFVGNIDQVKGEDGRIKYFDSVFVK